MAKVDLPCTHPSGEQQGVAPISGLEKGRFIGLEKLIRAGGDVMDGHNFERLKIHILKHSVSDDFDVARLEWSLAAVEVTEEFDQCPCGQDIKEHCYIRNRLNGNQTYVGNVCINRFLQINTGNLFEGLKRIAGDLKANANHDLIEHAWKMGYLYGEKEYSFLLQTMRSRKLSTGQMAWKEKINRRIVQQTVVKNRTHRT